MAAAAGLGAAAGAAFGGTMGGVGAGAVLSAFAFNRANNIRNAKLCSCLGCAKCKKPSLMTPFCRNEQECCNGRFSNFQAGDMCGECLEAREKENEKNK
tara:strand:+ start:425 stop:721 length:297 start_codon:yes stop_codon:yes gene_type:complete